MSMIPSRGANQYLQTQVQSRSPLELVVMLYDGAIQSADAARDALAAGNIPARRAALSRMTAIIAQLQNTLDMERGADIAENLDRIYSWAINRILDATVARDPKPIDEVRRVLENLREAWQTIASNQLAGTKP
jgi:flagellar secretion chaperone FliS